jgi:hypothetical protein
MRRREFIGGLGSATQAEHPSPPLGLSPRSSLFLIDSANPRSLVSNERIYRAPQRVTGVQASRRRPTSVSSVKRLTRRAAWPAPCRE